MRWKRRSTTLADRDCRLLVRPDAVLRVHSLLFSTSASAFAGNTRPFSLRDADGRAAFRAKPHTRARDDRESATGRSSRASRPLAPAPRLARAVARTWRPRRGTRRTSPPKTRATTAEPISRPRREAARAASRRTRARATRRRRRTRRRTRSLTKMKSPDRYGARLARRDTTRSRMRAARGCCFLFATFNAAFFPARCVSSRARARSVSATRVGECRAPRVHGRARADPERPPRAFPAFRADVRPLDAGSSEDARTRARASHSILASRSVTGPNAIAGRYFHRDFFVSPRFLFPSVPWFEDRFFVFAHAERAKRPKNLTWCVVVARSSSVCRRRNRACVWTARLSRAFPATSAGAAKCAIASRRIDETCAPA